MTVRPSPLWTSWMTRGYEAAADDWVRCPSPPQAWRGPWWPQAPKGTLVLPEASHRGRYGKFSELKLNITPGSLPRPQEYPLGKVSCDTAGCLMTIGGECSERNKIPSPLSIPDIPRLGQAITLNSKKSNSHSRPRVGKSGEPGSAGNFLGRG